MWAKWSPSYENNNSYARKCRTCTSDAGCTRTSEGSSDATTSSSWTRNCVAKRWKGQDWGAARKCYEGSWWYAKRDLNTFWAAHSGVETSWWINYWAWHYPPASNGIIYSKNPTCTIIYISPISQQPHVDASHSKITRTARGDTTADSSDYGTDEK